MVSEDAQSTSKRLNQQEETDQNLLLNKKFKMDENSSRTKNFFITQVKQKKWLRASAKVHDKYRINATDAIPEEMVQRASLADSEQQWIRQRGAADPLKSFTLTEAVKNNDDQQANFQHLQPETDQITPVKETMGSPYDSQQKALAARASAASQSNNILDFSNVAGQPELLPYNSMDILPQQPTGQPTGSKSAREFLHLDPQTSHQISFGAKELDSIDNKRVQQMISRSDYKVASVDGDGGSNNHIDGDRNQQINQNQREITARFSYDNRNSQEGGGFPQPFIGQSKSQQSNLEQKQILLSIDKKALQILNQRGTRPNYQSQQAFVEDAEINDHGENGDGGIKTSRVHKADGAGGAILLQGSIGEFQTVDSQQNPGQAKDRLPSSIFQTVVSDAKSQMRSITDQQHPPSTARTHTQTRATTGMRYRSSFQTSQPNKQDHQHHPKSRLAQWKQIHPTQKQKSFREHLQQHQVHQNHVDDHFSSQDLATSKQNNNNRRRNIKAFVDSDQKQKIHQEINYLDGAAAPHDSDINSKKRQQKCESVNDKVMSQHHQNNYNNDMVIRAGKLIQHQKGTSSVPAMNNHNRNRKLLKSSVKQTESKKNKKQLSVNLNHNVIGYNKQVMKPFTPTTKILVNQPNPRFQYDLQQKQTQTQTQQTQTIQQQSQQKRPGTAATLNFNSVKSEAVLMQRLNSQQQQQQQQQNQKEIDVDRLATLESLVADPFQQSVSAQDHWNLVEEGDHSKDKKPSKRKLVNRKKSRNTIIIKQGQLKQSNTAGNGAMLQSHSNLRKIKSQFATNMFNPQQMSKNLQLQSQLLHQKMKAQQLNKLNQQQTINNKNQDQNDNNESNQNHEVRNYTDGFIQNLQKKVKVQSSRGHVGYFEAKPPILGSAAAQQNASLLKGESFESFKKSLSLPKTLSQHVMQHQRQQ